MYTLNVGRAHQLNYLCPWLKDFCLYLFYEKASVTSRDLKSYSYIKVEVYKFKHLSTKHDIWDLERFAMDFHLKVHTHPTESCIATLFSAFRRLITLGIKELRLVSVDRYGLFKITSALRYILSSTSRLLISVLSSLSPQTMFPWHNDLYSLPILLSV